MKAKYDGIGGKFPAAIKQSFKSEILVLCFHSITTLNGSITKFRSIKKVTHVENPCET